MTTYELDARRLLCPMPVIRVQTKMKELKPGDILTVFCTDRGAMSDIPMWCRIHGHEILKIDQQPEQIVITIRVGNQ